MTFLHSYLQKDGVDSQAREEQSPLSGTGVNSITSTIGANLASQVDLNKMGNLAQVKSM